MTTTTYSEASRLLFRIKALQNFIKPNGLIKLGRANTADSLSCNPDLEEKILHAVENELNSLLKYFEEL